jgi:hypothetical protein
MNFNWFNWGEFAITFSAVVLVWTIWNILKWLYQLETRIRKLEKENE